jgi:nitrogen fixation/metabolism regulation signal transduction histidine kinase
MTRKKYVLDKKFQIGISFKAIFPPLITTLAILAVLLFFANETNNHANRIIDNQVKLIEMFLSNPAFQDSKDSMVTEADSTLKNNSGIIKKIKKNSSIVLYFLIIMTVVQTVIIFSLFIFFSHKISGPIHVMTNHLREIRKGNMPEFRPLRKNDELREFYDEFRQTLEYLQKI